MRSNNLSNLILSGNDEDKEQLIIDATEAVRVHIKKGFKSDLYNSMMRYEQDFKDNINDRLCNDTIKRALRKKLKSRSLAAHQEVLEYISQSKKTAASEQLDQLFDYWVDSTSEYMVKELKTMAYISHLHAMCQINEREEEIRREEDEFTRIQEEIPYMEKVLSEIDKNRRLPYCKIAPICEIETSETDKMLRVAKNYFIVSRHPDERKRVVMLSDKGKRCLQYVAYETKQISLDEAEQYVEIVSKSIFSSIRASMNHQIICDIQVPGTSPAKKRIIKYEHRKLVENLLSEVKTKETYNIPEKEYRITKPNCLLELSINGGK